MLRTELDGIRELLVVAAQAELNAWEQDAAGWDEELGFGGVCDRIAQALGGCIAQHITNVEIIDGGQDGDDHAFIIVQRNLATFLVDIPPQIYETGAGYCWRKRPNVQLTSTDILISHVNCN